VAVSYKGPHSALEEVVLLPHNSDMKVWRNEPKDCCSMKLGSTIMWKGIVPSKIDIFLWVLAQNKLCTRGFLANRNLIGYESAICSFCIVKTNLIGHLFLHCIHIWISWNKFLN